MKEQIKRKRMRISWREIFRHMPPEAPTSLSWVRRAVRRRVHAACWKPALTIIRNFPDISRRDYLLKKIGSFEGNGITVNHADAPISALKVALLVLIAGCGLVGAMAVFTDKVHSVEQAQQLLDMDVFGALPFVKKKQEQKSILITDPRTSSQYAEAVDKIVTKLRRKMTRNHYKCWWWAVWKRMTENLRQQRTCTESGAAW